MEIQRKITTKGILLLADDIMCDAITAIKNKNMKRAKIDYEQANFLYREVVEKAKKEADKSTFLIANRRIDFNILFSELFFE